MIVMIKLCHDQVTGEEVRAGRPTLSRQASTASMTGEASNHHADHPHHHIPVFPPPTHLIIFIMITILIISQAVSSGLTCRPQQDLVRPFLLEGLLLCQEGISAFTNINPHIIKPLFNFSKYFIAKLKTKSPVLALGEVHL